MQSNNDIDNLNMPNSGDNSRSEENSNRIKHPDNWTTGDEDMTGAQQSYLKTLSEEAGEEYDEKLTKAQAALRIEELQEKTGRGKTS